MTNTHTPTQGKKAYDLTPQELIDQGRALSVQSAVRLQQIAELEDLNDDLVNALEIAHASIKALEEPLEDGDKIHLLIHRQINAALAKARGEQS